MYFNELAVFAPIPRPTGLAGAQMVNIHTQKQSTHIAKRTSAVGDKNIPKKERGSCGRRTQGSARSAQLLVIKPRLRFNVRTKKVPKRLRSLSLGKLGRMAVSGKRL